MRFNFLNKKGASGLRPIIVGFAIVSFITLCLFTFAMNFTQNLNPDSTLMTDGGSTSLANSTVRLNNVMNEFTNTSNAARDALGDDESSNAIKFVFLIFESAFTIPKMMLTLWTTTWEVVATTIFPSLEGTGATVVGIGISLIGAILLITVVLYIIKAIRTGDSER